MNKNKRIVNNNSKYSKSVLILGDNLSFGGQQQFYYTISTHLRMNGWQVIYAYASDQCLEREWEFKWDSIAKLLALKGTGSLRDINNFTGNIKNVLQLVNYIKVKKVQVIISGSSWSHYIACLVRCFTGTRSLNIPGSPWISQTQHKYIRKFIGEAMMADVYYTISSHHRTELIASAIKKERLLFSNHGTDLQKFSPNDIDRKKVRASLGLKKRDIVLGYCGRLSEEKGLAAIIRVIQNVNHEGGNWKFIVIGNGPELDKLKELTKKLNVKSHVYFLGYIDSNNIAKYYSAMDLAIQYSSKHHGGEYNLGTHTVQALASGVPVLHFVPESICKGYKEGESGYYVGSAENELILKERLVLCERNSDDLYKMGKIARLFAEKNFDFSKVLLQIEYTLQRLFKPGSKTNNK